MVQRSAYQHMIANHQNDNLKNLVAMMNSGKQLVTSSSPFALSTDEAAHSRRAAQQAEREAREALEQEVEELPRKLVTLKLPPGRLEALSEPPKPRLIAKLKSPSVPYERRLPRELRDIIGTYALPAPRLLDLNLKLLINPDVSLGTPDPGHTDDERNKNATAHALRFGQGERRGKPPRGLSLNQESRELVLKNYILLQQSLPLPPGQTIVPVNYAYFDPKVDILHCRSKTEYEQIPGGQMKGTTISSFRDKDLIQRIAVPGTYFARINYARSPRPVLLNYPSLKEIIVLVDHLKICIHGNESSIGNLPHKLPKEHYVNKFKTLVEGKFGAEMKRTWGAMPVFRYVRTCSCDRTHFKRYIPPV